MMSEKEDLHELGTMLFEAISENCVIEKSDWAHEKINRVMKKFESTEMISAEFNIIIPWLDQFSAFTAPGSYIFISRKLFELCRTDEILAFLIAHEMAHHELGHFSIFPNWFRNISSFNIQMLLMAPYRAFESRIFGPENECDADRRALENCIKAGFDSNLCLELFDVLEKYALDIGDLDMVYGPSESDDELIDGASWETRFKIWLFQRKRGYLPIRDRKKMLMVHLESVNT
jgi:hypothetical protein